MEQTVGPEALIARLNQNVNDVDAAVALGNYYYDQGEAPMSIMYYRVALDINPGLAGVRTDMGTMYWRNENISLAEKTFRTVIAMQADFGHAYVNLGLLLQLAKGDTKAARAIWQQLVDNYPNHEVTPRARQLLQETLLQTTH